MRGGQSRNAGSVFCARLKPLSRPRQRLETYYERGSVNVEKAVNGRVKRGVTSRIPTGLGDFQLCLYTDRENEKEHFAPILGNVRGKSNILVRVQSKCFIGEVERLRL